MLRGLGSQAGGTDTEKGSEIAWHEYHVQPFLLYKETGKDLHHSVAKVVSGPSRQAQGSMGGVTMSAMNEISCPS